MSERQRKLYLASLVCWLVYCLSCPTWSGRLFDPDDPRSPRTWRRSGSARLTGVDGGATRAAPLWSPPRVDLPGIDAPPLWPGAVPTGYAHVVISPRHTFTRFMLGAALIGLLPAAGLLLGRRGRSDRLLWLIGSVSLAVLVSWFVLAYLETQPRFARKLTDRNYCVLLLVGAAGGYLIWSVLSRWCQPAGRPPENLH